MYLGVDIGGTAVKYGLVDENGQVVSTEEYQVDFDGYQTPILETVLRTSKDYLNRHRGDGKPLLGIGVSATGQIDVKEGCVAGTGGNIRNWGGSRIRKAYMEAFGRPCTVINDANSVALGEMWTGAARGYTDFAVITVGTGIGGGIVADGRLLQGKRGFGGEIGHLIIAGDGRRCTCGNCGCLEQYASVTALVRRVGERCPELAGKTLNGRVIFELAGNGHENVSAVIKEWIADLSRGIISLVHLLNPQLILLGGGVSTRQELFIRPLSERVMAGLMPNFAEHLEIRGAALGNTAGLIGAVYYLKKTMDSGGV